MSGLRTQSFGDRGNDLRGDTQAAGSVVPGNLVGNESEERSQCPGSATDSRAGKLRDGVDLAAQAAAGNGQAESR